jgi:hypothetical protein
LKVRDLSTLPLLIAKYADQKGENFLRIC